MITTSEYRSLVVTEVKNYEAHCVFFNYRRIVTQSQASDSYLSHKHPSYSSILFVMWLKFRYITAVVPHEGYNSFLFTLLYVLAHHQNLRSFRLCFKSNFYPPMMSIRCSVCSQVNIEMKHRLHIDCESTLQQIDKYCIYIATCIYLRVLVRIQVWTNAPQYRTRFAVMMCHMIGTAEQHYLRVNKTKNACQLGPVLQKARRVGLAEVLAIWEEISPTTRNYSVLTLFRNYVILQYQSQI